MPDQHDLMTAQTGQAAVDRRVVAEGTIAVELAELSTDQIDVIAEEWALRVPGDLNGFPGAQVVVGLAEQGRVVVAKLAKLFRIIRSLLGLHRFELADLLFEDGQWAFELQHVAGAAIGAVTRTREPARFK